MRIRDCSSDVCSADLPQAVPAERLQMVAEDTWYAADAGKDAAAKRSVSHEREQRQKAALLIKQQRPRITNLERLREDDALKLTATAERSAQRRVGKEYVGQWRITWWLAHHKKK